MKFNSKNFLITFFIILIIGFIFLKKNVLISKNQEKLPPEAQTLLKNGAKNLKAKKIDYAIDDFSALTKLYPDIEIAYYNLGLAYAENKQLNKSIIEWQKAIALNDKFPMAHFNLAQAYKLTNNNHKAAYHLNKYLFLEPNDPNATKIKKEILSLQKPLKSNGIIAGVYLTDSINKQKNKNITVKNLFSQNTKEIFCLIETSSALKTNEIETKWGYRATDNSIVPINTAKTTVKGMKNIISSIQKPEGKWPSGEYELKILVNGKENSISQFYIQN